MNAYTQHQGKVQAVPVAGLRAKLGGHPATLNAIRPSQPLHWVLVIDASGSMITCGGTGPSGTIDAKDKRKWHLTIDLAQKIVAGAPKDTDIGLLMFWGEGVETAPATKDKEALLTELEHFRQIGADNQKPGRTPLWDSISRANKMLSPSSARNVIVVISDGGENNSRSRESALRKELARTGTRIFSLVLYESDLISISEARAEATDLVNLAEDRGGIALTLDAENLVWQKPPEIDQTLSATAAILSDFATNSYEIDLVTNARARIEDLVVHSDARKTKLAYPRAVLSCTGRE